MYIFVPAIGTSTFKYRISACILSASRAVIGACTADKFIPAVPAQVIVGFTNVFAAVDADCGPKEMIYPVEGKNNSLFYFPRIHIGNYTNSCDTDKIRYRCYPKSSKVIQTHSEALQKHSNDTPKYIQSISKVCQKTPAVRPHFFDKFFSDIRLNSKSKARNPK
jgi:hypothetical protein